MDDEVTRYQYNYNSFYEMYKVILQKKLGFGLFLHISQLRPSFK